MRRRAQPSFYVLDRGLTVILACGDAPVAADRLPANLEQIARDLLASADVTVDEFVVLVDEFVALEEGRLLRFVSPSATTEPYLCLFLERARGGDPVADATRRYALTPRESDVLRLMLGGRTTESIAHELHIATTTVAEYSKGIILKTGCRNRAQVVARVLGGL